MDAVVRALERSDHLRRSPWGVGGDDGHKEWLHFCIYAPDVDALVNFSLVDDVGPGARRGSEHARLTVLVRERDRGWDGDVRHYAPAEVSVRGGAVAARFGESAVELRGGRYHLAAHLRDRAISVEATLAPVTMPSLANNIQLDAGPPINWLVAPRLVAAGRITVAGREHPFEHALAYHDHNWGHFAWGRDFAWEWGFALPTSDPSSPWSFVFVRLSDRAHVTTFMQAVFLWKGARQERVLQASDVRVKHAGLLRAERVLKLPRVMALLSPGRATDVPRQLDIDAAGDGDTLACRFDATDGAQVVIPNDRGFGVTIINEVSGTVSLDGRVRGEPVRMTGRAIFEFLGA